MSTIEHAVVVSAGIPEHVGTISATRSRAMLPIVGKPFAVRIMDRIRQAGINQFTVVLGPDDSGLANYLNESWYPDVTLNFAMHNGPDGAANALISAIEYLNDNILVTNTACLFSTTQYAAVCETYLQQPESPLFVTTDQNNSFDVFAEVDNNQITGIHSSPGPQHVAVHMLAAMSAKTVQDIVGEVQTTNRPVHPVRAIQTVNNTTSGTIRTTHMVDYYPLMSAKDLLKINEYYLDDGIGSYILTELDKSVIVHPPVRIDPDVWVGHDAEIGPYVYLESGARIEQGAVLRNSIVLRRGRVFENQTVENLVIAKGL